MLTLSGERRPSSVYMKQNGTFIEDYFAFARNDVAFGHCEERSEEAISKMARNRIRNLCSWLNFYYLRR